MPNKFYTVVGYYTDNNQPWVRHVKASSPLEAAIKAVNGSSKIVVEVFEGRQYGILQSDLAAPDTTFNLKDLIALKVCASSKSAPARPKMHTCVKGLVHTFRWTGKMPCTGRYTCVHCGKTPEELQPERK